MSQKAIDIVKRSSKRSPKTEYFDRNKLHRSLRAACLSVRSPEGEASQAADKVCDAVIVWLEKRPEVTSQDVRRIAARHLSKHNPDAAYIYEYNRYTL